MQEVWGDIIKSNLNVMKKIQKAFTLTAIHDNKISLGLLNWLIPAIAKELQFLNKCQEYGDRCF